MRLPLLAATSAATLAVLAVNVVPADAVQRRVAVPHKFDGQWSITVMTQDGPCDRAYRYAVQIHRGEAIYPGGDVQIQGRVGPSGAVNGVISSGGNAARVAGRLNTRGSGGGTWGTVSGFACSGNWTATRRG